jgi:hypothetical protein
LPSRRARQVDPVILALVFYDIMFYGNSNRSVFSMNKKKVMLGVDGIKFNIINLAERLESISKSLKTMPLDSKHEDKFVIGQASACYALREIGGELSVVNYNINYLSDLLEDFYKDYNNEVV